MKVKYRVRWEPKYNWFVIEKKYWIFRWEYVDSYETQERAITVAKEIENPIIVWESNE